MTDDELREPASTVEDSLAQLAGQAQQLEVKAIQLAAEIEQTRRTACALTREFTERAGQTDHRAGLEQAMTELAVALSRKDYTEARKRFDEIWSSAEEQDADYVAELKTEISAQLAAELKRPISEKARRNLRAWYGLDLPANANYATALQIKLPWLEISLD